MNNNCLKVAKSLINGDGCFSKIQIAANAPIIEITGELYENAPNDPANRPGRRRAIPGLRHGRPLHE